MPNHMKLSGKPSDYFPFKFYLTKCELSDSIIAAAYCETSALGWVILQKKQMDMSAQQYTSLFLCTAKQKNTDSAERAAHILNHCP